MLKKPIVNATFALIYIAGIALFMFYGTKYAPKEDTFLAPVAMISLFTLSAAVMGYLFCYQPLVLYFDGKKHQAVNYFFTTVAVFAAYTFILLVALFLGLGS